MERVSPLGFGVGVGVGVELESVVSVLHPEARRENEITQKQIKPSRISICMISPYKPPNKKQGLF